MPTETDAVSTDFERRVMMRTLLVSAGVLALAI
jgi:hypothetical protein